jgi:glycosyltransferase involved in cell wall biosynthesis
MRSGKLNDESRPRKVAIVSDAIHPYHRGGKELRYYELTQRLASRVEVDVYTMHWWAGSPVRVEGGVTFHAISPLVPLYVNERRSLLQAFRFGLACFRMFRYDFDVLEADHIPFLQVLVLYLVTTLKRKRFVVTWHEVWGREYWRRYLGLAGYAAWIIEALAMKLPDHIVAASPQTAERLRSSLGDRRAISMAPNGTDLAAVEAVSPDSAPTDLVVVGRLMAHKRVDMLLESVAILHTEGLLVTCRVIGNGPERVELHQKVQRLGIARFVDFRDDVSEQKDVYSLLKAARVCVFPSAREGFGIAVLEALACGVPVITTSAPDNLAQHLVARSMRGIVCDPSAEALAAAIRGVLSDDRVTPGSPDAWLREYSWDAMTDVVAEALGVPDAR